MNIEEILKKEKKSVTPERQELFLYMQTRHLFTACDIEKAFSHIGRASVFRTVKLFLEIGVLRRVSL
jgi:Fe2+ or Zn2+ uptake regulation protein